MSAEDWYDLDSAAQYDSCCKALENVNARSFAVRFHADTAHCALNPSQKCIESLLQGPVDRAQRTRQTRWINFWASKSDHEAVRAVGKHYGVSPRLTALLCSTRTKHPDGSSVPPGPRPRSLVDLTQSPSVDLERASGLDASPRRLNNHTTKAKGFGDVFGDLWHFCSVDQGPGYLYVGFNALFNVPEGTPQAHSDLSRPHGLPIWTSLMLFHDGTIMSIFEEPPPGTPLECIKSMRYNVLNIHRRLSKLHSPNPVDTLMQINVRLYESPDCTTVLPMDSAALLFYYLFDDWTTTYGLVTQRDNPYRDQLEALRQRMLEKADVDLIKSLDLVGRQLTTLKLMYQSYELITLRLLNPRMLNHLWGQTLTIGYDHGPSPDQVNVHETSSRPTANPVQDVGSQVDRGLRLPLSATTRFERLLDRIRLYALTEIDECPKQKEALVLMNFNLIAFKESQAVEKLTRTTMLLAKVTILFLPVSLMTAYFSMQFAEISKLYSLETYWFCFLVVVVLSIVVLMCFGVLAETLSGKVIYNSLTSITLGRLKRAKTKRL